MLVVFFFQSSIARAIARRKECIPENERKDDGVLDAKRFFCVRAVAVDDDVAVHDDVKVSVKISVASFAVLAFAHSGAAVECKFRVGWNRTIPYTGTEV